MYRTFYFAVLVFFAVGCSRGGDRKPEGESAMADGKLADKTFDKLMKHYGKEPNLSRMPEPHRTVLLAYHVHGIIGNGGFQYLFEADLPGDPELVYTRQAFKTIKAQKASEAFEKALAVFPNSTPPRDIERRLKIYQAKYTLMDAIQNKQSPDAMFMDAMNDTMEKVESYIRNNQASFDTLR